MYMHLHHYDIKISKQPILDDDGGGGQWCIQMILMGTRPFRFLADVIQYFRSHWG